MDAPEISGVGFVGDWMNENSAGDFITTSVYRNCIHLVYSVPYALFEEES